MAKEPVYKHLHFQSSEQEKPSSAPAEKAIAISDLHIWQEFKNGSESAFATIYEQHVTLLYRYGLKLVYNYVV